MDSLFLFFILFIFIFPVLLVALIKYFIDELM